MQPNEALERTDAASPPVPRWTSEPVTGGPHGVPDKEISLPAEKKVTGRAETTEAAEQTHMSATVVSIGRSADDTGVALSERTGPLTWVARNVAPLRVVTDVLAIAVANALVLHHDPRVLVLTFLPTLTMFRFYAPSLGVLRPSAISEAPRLFAASAVASMIVAVAFPYAFSTQPRRLAAVVTATVLGVAVFSGRAALYFLAARLRRQRIGLDPTLIVGQGRTVRALVQKIESHPEVGLRIAGVVADGGGDSKVDSLLGVGPEDLPALITRNEIRHLVLVPDEDDLAHVTECFMAADGLKVQVSLVPPLHDFLLSPARVEHIEGVPLIPLGRLSYAPRMMPGKRIMDIVGAGLGLLLASPVLLAVAAAIKLHDRGPVFFKQRRAGYKGRTFKMIKFRSMCVDAEARLAEVAGDNKDSVQWMLGDSRHRVHDDPRVTPVGRFIRRFSIDELPQLINVFKGEMSLVGPRPLNVEMEHFGDLGIKRLNVRPGVTGFWQILSRVDLTYEEMVKLDLSYIQNWSLWVDIQLILRTIPAIITRRGDW